MRSGQCIYRARGGDTGCVFRGSGLGTRLVRILHRNLGRVGAKHDDLPEHAPVLAQVLGERARVDPGDARDALQPPRPRQSTSNVM